MFDTSSKTIGYAPRLNYLRETAFDPHFFFVKLSANADPIAGPSEAIALAEDGRLISRWED